jgi:actin-related protein
MGKNLCCVVDIGHDKMSVCCIEEGSIIRNSLFRKNFGSRDLDYCYKLQCQGKNLIRFISDTSKNTLNNDIEMDQFSKIKEIGMNMSKREDNSNIVFKCIAESNNKETQF